MPTSQEKAVNRPLSGTELRSLLREDFERLLDAEGLLSPHIAFGRVSWNLRLTLHVDRAVGGRSESTVDSRFAGVNVIAEHPELEPVERFPLAEPSPDAVTSAHEATREVRSPNSERLRAGLPITVEVRGQDAAVRSEKVVYPKDASQPDNLVIADVSEVKTASRPAPATADDDVLKRPAASRDFWADNRRETRNPDEPWPVTEPS